MIHGMTDFCRLLVFTKLNHESHYIYFPGNVNEKIYFETLSGTLSAVKAGDKIGLDLPLNTAEPIVGVVFNKLCMPHFSIVIPAFQFEVK